MSFLSKLFGRPDKLVVKPVARPPLRADCTLAEAQARPNEYLVQWLKRREAEALRRGNIRQATSDQLLIRKLGG